MTNGKQLVATIPERCRVCYTCVRDCPAKAIRIRGGQAEVVADRCIGCGNCVKVCNREAKQVRDSRAAVRALIASGRAVAAIVAPSFPAEFPEIAPARLVGALRKLGFDAVCEVAFGADLVADRYRRLIEETPDKRWIATTCPGIVSFVEKFEPELVENLAPIASPMTAMARVLRDLHGDDLGVVFIGPCIAKQNEAGREDLAGDVDAVLSFAELRRMFAVDGIEPDAVPESGFDGPHPGLGALFPVSHGMLQAAGMHEDLLTNEVMAGTGLHTFRMAIDEFAAGMEVRLLELLCCKGCIMGAGMTSREPQFRRRAHVSHYVRDFLEESEDRPGPTVADFEDLDLSVSFANNDTRMSRPSPAEMQAILSRLGKECPDEELDCGACGYLTCREHAIAIHTGMAESEMCLPYTIERLRTAFKEVHESHKELEETQQALIQSEKLASMGQLSAGIAHEVNNPLGVVLLYAGILLDETEEGSELHEDLTTIVEQANRCKTVVSGLLDFARKNKVVLKRADARELAARALRGVVLPEGVKAAVRAELADPWLEVDEDQMLQVLTNLVKNAVEAMPGGGEIEIACEDNLDDVRFTVSDTGTGIAEEHLQKIFEPLFTTKDMGKGTGLGLAVTYGIVKMHKGRLSVESNADPEAGPTGTRFVIDLPRNRKGNDDD